MKRTKYLAIIWPRQMNYVKYCSDFFKLLCQILYWENDATMLKNYQYLTLFQIIWLLKGILFVFETIQT